jgi:hypothetical protein
MRAEGEFTSSTGASSDVRRPGRWGLRRPPRLRRFLPEVLAGLGAVAVFWLVGDRVLGHGWEVAAGCLAWTTVTAHLWRAAEGGGFGSVFARRRARRVVYRVGIVLVYGGICAASVAGLSDGLLGGAVVLALAEPLIWRVYPSGLREGYRRVRIQIAVAEAEPRWLGQRHGFDPEQGAVGRPGPADSVEPGLPGEPMTQRPTVEVAEARDGLLVSESIGLATWWQYGRVAWDGSLLSVTDAHIQTTVLPLHRDDGAEDHVAEIVWCGIYRSEWSGTVAGSLRANQILFLDATGRQYARMPALGFQPRQIKLIAKAAGLRYNEYSIGVGSYGLNGLNALLFPSRRDTMIVSFR